MTYFHSLSAAGFAATAITFGPARIGYGLFVPDFRTAFSMSTSSIGAVSSFGFFGFFIGLVISQAQLGRHAPETPVLSGLLAATVGMGIVAAATNVFILAIGVFIAAASGGFAWTPFNDAVHRKVDEMQRTKSLSEISTGTGLGIAVAAIVALVTFSYDLSWRFFWGGFAAASAIVLVGNWAVLRWVDKSPDTVPKGSWRTVVAAATIPLFAISFVFGTTSAIYISFAADHVVSAGGLSGLPVASTPAVIFICYGTVGLTGLLTARIKAAIGLAWLLRLLMATATLSLVLVALLPGNWVGLLVSAGLQGMTVMMTSAILAHWSERLFPALPSYSFTAALLAMAAGSTIGPILAGYLSQGIGSIGMFLCAAALPAATGVALRDRHARDTPLTG